MRKEHPLNNRFLPNNNTHRYFILLGMRGKKNIASFVKVDYSNERSDVYLIRFRPLVKEREEFFALFREEEKAV